MGFFAFLIPLVCMGIGYYLGVNLSARQKYRPLGLIILVCAVGFWFSVQLAQGQAHAGTGGVGFAVVAFLVILPAAAGLLAGLAAGWLRRRRMSRNNG